MTDPYSFMEAWVYDFFIAPAVKDMMENIVEELFIIVKPGDHLLDVGCGGGQILTELAHRFNDIKLTGVDLSKGQVKRAGNRTKKFSERVNIKEGNALSLPFENDYFDGIYSVASIKHWPDQVKGISECIRVLKPGGYILIVEADRGCRMDDSIRFVDKWRLPKIMRPLLLAMFRTWVAGQAIDLDDSRGLMSQFNLTELEINRIAKTPALMIKGKKS